MKMISEYEFPLFFFDKKWRKMSIVYFSEIINNAHFAPILVKKSGNSYSLIFCSCRKNASSVSLLYVCLSAVCCLCLSVSLLCSMQLNFKFFWNLHGFSIDCTIPSLVSSLSPNPCIFVFLYYNYSLQLFEVGLEERKLAEVSCLSCISSHIVSQFY